MSDEDGITLRIPPGKVEELKQGHVLRVEGLTKPLLVEAISFEPLVLRIEAINE